MKHRGGLFSRGGVGLKRGKKSDAVVANRAAAVAAEPRPTPNRMFDSARRPLMLQDSDVHFSKLPRKVLLVAHEAARVTR